MVIVWYNCKDINVSVVCSANLLYSNIYRRFSCSKQYFSPYRGSDHLPSSDHVQEIDDMQAKIVIYLRIIIQFIKLNYICTMCFINLAMVWMTVNFI